MNQVGKGLLTVATATAAAVALLPGAAHAAIQPGWWSTEGYTVTNTGFNPNEPTLTPAKVAGLKLLRSTSTDLTHQSAPVLDKGRVFVYSAQAVIAYDEVTGEQLWRHDQPVDAWPNKDGRMVVSEGKLVVAWNDGSPPMGGDSLEVLDAETGAVLVAPQLTLGTVEILLVDKGVVVKSGETRWDSDTVAYSLSDGKVLWRDSTYMYQPVSANGRILVRGHADGNSGPQVSKVLDIVTGKVLVSVPNTYYSALAATPDGAKFYLAWGHSLQVLDATTGKLSWLASNVYPKYAALSPSRLYIATTDNKMIAFNLSNNTIAWTKTFTGPLLRPIVAGGVLYVSEAGGMHALNPVDGAPLPSPAFTGAAWPPVVTGAKVFRTDDQKMSVYGL